MATKKGTETTETIVIETESIEEPEGLSQAARKLVLLSVGILALAKDGIEEVIDRVVDRGEMAEQNGRRLFREAMDRQRGKSSKAEERLSRQIESVMDQKQIVSKTDLDILSDKIARLSDEIDKLSKT